MSEQPEIKSRPGGPLMVSGQVPLVRKTPVHSEHGEPLAWQTSEPITGRASYALCRCGASENKPFCDGAHNAAGFDGEDTFGDSTYAERASELGGTGVTVTDDRSVCMHAGFCGNRNTNIWKQVDSSDDSMVRLAIINEVEKCPSGALTYKFDNDTKDTEPDYPQQVGIVDDGPFWVTGSIPITNSNGDVLETRNRVTLCRCGASANKPLCDGSHKEAGFADSADE